MCTLEEMYDKMELDFDTSRELVSVSYKVKAKTSIHLLMQGEELFAKTQNEVLIKRKAEEDHFYKLLKHQLFHKIHEMKAYSDVDITTSRRLVSVSDDCITMLHFLIRDKIYLNVYFRSSDYDGALPIDLQFISSLPEELLLFLNKHKNDKKFEELHNNVLANEIFLKEIEINISFGSLHRTK